MPTFIIVITTLVGMGNAPALNAGGSHGPYASLEECEAAARAMPMDEQHRAMCLPVEGRALATDAAH